MEDQQLSPALTKEGNGDQQPTEEHDRLAQPVFLEEPPRLPFPIVGIGGSAGGLEAFIDFFKAVPPDSGMAFVVVQHLPPDRESMIAEILSKHTKMPVAQIVDGMEVLPNHAYVIRPGHTLTIHKGRLHLGAPVGKPGFRHPVDWFFRSLAEEQRERAICIIMSGMGSNGSAGAQAVKAVGGVCIAQDPESAKYPSMPQSLIDVGLSDFILRPEHMPEVLQRYSSHPYAKERTEAEQILERQRKAFNEIFAILRTRSRQDFSGYRKATVLRRIQRRMGLHQIVELGDYVKVLRQIPSEATALADDLVIHVTGFFREPHAWDSLNKRVIQPLVESRESGSEIRAWVTACSSGEESYSLVMLLLEAIEASGKQIAVKVFSTDVADRTLAHARAGVYPQGIESDISPARLQRFFEEDDKSYRVKRELRDAVIFGPQNVLQDPPFSKLDICTCRNLLIYLVPDTQQRLLTLLHFGLREGGALFLGSSETIAGVPGMFEPIDKRSRIYRRIGPPRHGLIDFPLRVRTPSNEPESLLARPLIRPSVANLAQRTLLERYTPAAVVVDRDHQVIYFHGDTTPFLMQPAGEPTRALLDMAREGVRSVLRVALHKAMAEQASVTVHDGNLDTSQGRVHVEINVAPLDHNALDSGWLVTFLKVPVAPQRDGNGDEPADSIAQPQVDEFQSVRDELQTTVEELQSANEELRASNEEVSSVNEELQSTNEELETSKEELQSVNEEMTTVNAQLQNKMEELETATNDLTSLLMSTNIAVIFLDRGLRIRRFTPSVLDVVEILQSDIGRPLSDLAPKLEDPNLIPDARAVLDKLMPIQRELQNIEGDWYLRRVLPYRTADDRIDGVVITYVDVTRSLLAEIAQREGAEEYRLIVDAVREYAIFMIDPSGKITVWNAGAERVLGFSEKEAVGQNARFIFTPEDRAKGEPEKELQTARDRGHAMDERWHLRKNGERFWGSGIVTAVYHTDGSLRGFVKVMRDNTDRKVSEQSLEEARRAAVAASDAKDQFLAVVSHELRTPLSVILLWTKMIKTSGLGKKEFAEGLGAIESSAEAQKQLIEDLLDTTRISSGKLRLNMRETDLVEVTRAAVNTIRPTADARGVQIREDYGKDVGMVQADPDRLQQIIWNVLSNAVKFTPANGRVEVGLWRRDDGIEIRIADTGRGMAPDFLPHLFERFKQAESVHTRAHGGLGLGLAISKQLVELHGGTIEAHTAGLDKGSTFTVHLPLPRLRRGKSKSSGAPSSADLSDHPLADTHILLVEDNEETAKAVALLLRTAGAKVTSALSAAAALKEFSKSRPDLILSDIAMPDMDGYALIQKIRATEKSQKADPIPAVSLSAFAREEDRLKAIRSGFNDHVAKPIDTQQLISTLTRALNRS